MFSIIRNLFDPVPRYSIESKTSPKTGETYHVRTNEDTRDRAGKPLWQGGPKSGAIVQSDSRGYKMAMQGLGIVPTADWKKDVLPFTTKVWTPGLRLNQGQRGACVSFANTGRNDAGPKIKKLGNDFANTLYDEGCAYEGHPGQDTGLYTITGVKMMQRHGLVDKYYDIGYWSNESTYEALNTIISWLHAGRGPILIGAPWKSGMNTPNSKGIVKYTGPFVGGHCFFCNGVQRLSAKDGLLCFVNSWGTSWGDDGKFYMRFDEARRMFNTWPDILAIDEHGVVVKPQPVLPIINKAK